LHTCLLYAEKEETFSFENILMFINFLFHTPFCSVRHIATLYLNNSKKYV
jgi:hypothetical protein